MMEKNLVSTFGRRPQWPKREDKKSMSVLIGIICSDSIVLATDSQTTDTSTGEFDYVDKISIIDFFAEQVLVAQGGLWTLTNRIVEIMREKARETKITNARSVTQIVEDSIRAAKFPLDEKQQDYVNQCATGLLIAFYVGNKPHIYTIDCYGSGIINPAEKRYATMGCGSAALANYLLEEYAAPKSTIDFAIAASIFVVKKVIENNALCGGNIIVKQLVPSPISNWHFPSVGVAGIMPQTHISLYEKQLATFDEKTKVSRNKQVNAVLKKVSQKISQQHLKWAKIHDHQIQDIIKQKQEYARLRLLRTNHDKTIVK